MIITEILDSPEVQEDMQDETVSKKAALKHYANLKRQQANIAADVFPLYLLEIIQLTVTLRFHYRVSDIELDYAIEVRS